MPQLKRYRVFISHAWAYNESYYRLENMLNDASYFHWENYSVPEHDPKKTKTKRELTQALYNQIRPTNIVMVLSGMYVNYREWIEKEINIALELGKPIIGITPRGSERVPHVIKNVSKIIVGWNTQSIINAIRDYAI